MTKQRSRILESSSFRSGTRIQALGFQSQGPPCHSMFFASKFCQDSRDHRCAASSLDFGTILLALSSSLCARDRTRREMKIRPNFSCFERYFWQYLSKISPPGPDLSRCLYVDTPHPLCSQQQQQQPHYHHGRRSQDAFPSSPRIHGGGNGLDAAAGPDGARVRPLFCQSRVAAGLAVGAPAGNGVDCCWCCC